MTEQVSEEAHKPKKTLMQRMREYQTAQEEASKTEAGAEVSQEEAKKEFETVEQQETISQERIEEVNEKLKAYLYDDELVKEYSETFLKINSEVLDTVFELLEFKELEIGRLTKNKGLFKSESNPDSKQVDKQEPAIDPVEAILAQRYK